MWAILLRSACCRNIGITTSAKPLLRCTTANLRKRNFSMLSLTVTEANARAVELYVRLGFEKKRVFDAFVWEG